MRICMKTSLITPIISVFSFIVIISLISEAVYAQQQDQAASFLIQNTSKPIQDPLSSNESKYQTQKLEIKRSGSQPTTKGPADYFTGDVLIDPLFEANHP